jgi:hypothetical protein
VLPFPLFAPDAAKFITGKSKAKTGSIPDSELCLKSFEFKYTDQLEQFVTDSVLDELIALAPATENGMQWLSHAARMGSLFIERDLPFRCGRYIYLGTQALLTCDVTSPSPAELDTAYHAHVYNYITASWFRTYVLAPFHQKIAKSGRGALSLGGATTLLSALVLENKHVAEIKSTFTGTTAVAVQYHTYDFAKVTEPKTKSSPKRSLLAPVIPELVQDPITLVAVDPIPSVVLPPSQEFASSCFQHYAERWCIENEQPDTFDDMLRSGAVCLVTQDHAFGSQLKEAVTSIRSNLMSFGLQLHDNQLDHVSIVSQLASRTNMPLVLPSHDFEEDLLFTHLREMSYLTYLKPDTLRNPARVHVNPIADYTPGSVNNGYAVALDNAPDANDYFNLLGTYGFVTGPKTTSIPVIRDSQDRTWLPKLLEILRGNGVRSTYALILMRSLRKRKMLARNGLRFELTSYGFAYAQALSRFLDSMESPYSKLLDNFTIAIESSSNRPKTLEKSLELAFDAISVMRAKAAKMELPKKQIKKAGSDKKTTWTLTFDHANHVAYWQTRKGKRRAVWYKIKNIEHDSEAGVTVVTSALDMFPKSEKSDIVIVPYQCGECLGIGQRLTDSKDSGKLKTTCLCCGNESTISTVTIIKEYADG